MQREWYNKSMNAKTPLTFIDRLIIRVDESLRTWSAKPQQEWLRKNPSEDIKDVAMDTKQRQHSAGLMRVNHAGEVCAQALYQGQAFTARHPDTKENMKVAAQEEIDHLLWCKQRLHELGSHTSYFDPLWYVGSLSIGIVAGLAGDEWSLGFVAETERQVVQHLQSHLEKLPEVDEKSRAIVTQMHIDEAKHATMAVESGAKELPLLVKTMMRVTAKVMTTVAYWV